MLPKYLLPESVARENGSGPEFSLGNVAGKPVLLTLGITRIMEHESLEISVLGSSAAGPWEKLLTFPAKSYCGNYSLLLDLNEHPDITKIRADWRMNRWGHSGRPPLFEFYLMAEEARDRVTSAVA